MSLAKSGYVKRIYEGVDEFRENDFIEFIAPEAWKLVIDDFERIEDKKCRARIAELAKSFSDQATPFSVSDDVGEFHILGENFLKFGHRRVFVGM